MIKKFLLTLIIFLPLLVSAQTGTGQWKLHPYFAGASATNCIDTGDKIYYIAGGSLFAFDKESQTNSLLDVQGKLNDINITQIYYNYDSQYLVIAYQDCNIDIIKEDGQIVNIPDFKEAALPKAKTINDVTFANGKAYVATSFGHLIIDDNTLNIIEFGNYQYNISSAAIIGDTYVLSLNNQFWYFVANDKTETVWNHKTFFNNLASGRIYPINDSKFFLTTSNAFYVVKVGHGTGDDGVDTCSFTPTKIESAAPVTVQPTPTGFVASFFSKNYYYTFDKNGENKTKYTGNELYTSQEEGNWWVLGTNGLAHIENGVKGEYFQANGITISANAYWTTYDAAQQRVILCRTADNYVLQEANSKPNTATVQINSFDGSMWHDITPYGATGQGNYLPVMSPNEPNTYYYCSRSPHNICKIKNDTVVTRYTTANSPLNNRPPGIRFDSKGNLWIAQTCSSNIDAFVMTPDNQLLTTVDSSKFIINNLGGICKTSNGGFKRISFDIGAGDTKVFGSGEWGHPLIVWTSNDDLSPKQVKAISSFVDQNRKDYTYYSSIYIKADREGMVWVGNSSGVYWFDPLTAFDDDFHINRIYAKRNDGSGQIDEFVPGIQVNAIDADSQNRKWIGTNSAGVYLLSADASEIIYHFDTSNSLLPSDRIYSVCCNDATNSVMIVTASGVVEFFPDAEGGVSDYSETFAFPNPVKPDFTGLITIKNLMLNSNVIITDGAGNTVATLTSQGDNVTWDGCDSNGNRLKTGLYNVYASQGNPDITGTPVTKIAIIK